VRTVIHYFYVSHLQVSPHALAELSAAVERDLQGDQVRAQFYETMLLPILATSGAIGVRERWRPLRQLLTRPSL
jgi:hypothetical protein